MAAERASLESWLRLSLLPGLAPAHWRLLLSTYGSPDAVLGQTHSALARMLGPALAAAILRGAAPADVQTALDWATNNARAILTADDSRFPVPLSEIHDTPPVLYAAGRLDLLQRPGLAIVGSRNASAQGMRNAEEFARAISAAGVCVVSGLALGIDAAAHRGSLTGVGSTIAVLGNGIDVIYPRRNAALLEQILDAGLVLSEFALRTAPHANNFPRRNRIISGLCRGCLVVEAAMASGSLITARLAVEMGRDVFAIPGSIHSPLAKGCHYLIKQGAKLVESPQEVLEEFGLASVPTQIAATPMNLSPEATIVLAALGHDACDIDTLAVRTHLPVDRLVALLMHLEIEGRISRSDGGIYQRLD